ncbi:MAG: glycosyltransferase family 39 protein [Anaerolineales bacterium]|nr:glycosyltransferase family 39 protein [Anaerolineales bacterium]
MSLLKSSKHIGLLVFCYILLTALSYSVSAYQPIIVLVVGASIWWLASKPHPTNENKYLMPILCGVILFGIIIRFLWAILIPAIPADDCQYYYESALRLSHGDFVLTKNIGYTLLLSAAYRIYPSILAGKLINAAASTLSMILLYLLGVKLIGRKGGLIAMSLFAILPSEIFMVSALSTDILASLFGVLTALLLVNSSKNQRISTAILLLCSGLAYGVGFTIRSSLIFYSPAIVLWFILVYFPIGRNMVKMAGLFFSGIIAGLFVVLIGYFFSTGQFTIKPLLTQDSYPFLSGTNFDTSGMWSQEDAQLYFSWPVSERDMLAKKEAFNRIKSDPLGFLLLLPRKFSNLMGNNEYALLWSLQAVDWGNGNLWGVHGVDNWERISSLRSKLLTTANLFSQSVYIVICFFSFFAFRQSKNNHVLFMGLILILLTFLPHIILETQGRYHHYIMPFMVLLAADGIISINNAA